MSDYITCVSDTFISSCSRVNSEAPKLGMQRVNSAFVRSLAAIARGMCATPMCHDTHTNSDMVDVLEVDGKPRRKRSIQLWRGLM